MLYTLRGEGTGKDGEAARQKQEFHDAGRLLKADPVDYLQPFFDEAERRHPGPTKNLDKRAKELKDKTIEVIRERLQPRMGSKYADESVKKVTVPQIKGCYQFARDREEEERDKKRKAEERRKQKQLEQEERQTTEKRKEEEEAAQKERDEGTAARSVDAQQGTSTTRRR